MLEFTGIAYDKDHTQYDFTVRALSEKEAKNKVKQKYRNRKIPIRLIHVELEYVEIVAKRVSL